MKELLVTLFLVLPFNFSPKNQKITEKKKIIPSEKFITINNTVWELKKLETSLTKMSDNLEKID